MKLQEICDSLHFNELKAPGTLIECIRKIPGPFGGNLIDVGEILKVSSFYEGRRESKILTKNFQIFKEEGVSNFMKVENNSI